jgi:hypothetical protein
VEANGELFERCFAIPSRSCKQFRREMVTKARVYFGYSEKTIAQDILRPMLKAYTRYVADQRNSSVEVRPTSAGTDVQILNSSSS